MFSVSFSLLAPTIAKLVQKISNVLTSSFVEKMQVINLNIMQIILNKQQCTRLLIKYFKLPFTQRNFQDNGLCFHLWSTVSRNFTLRKKLISTVKICEFYRKYTKTKTQINSAWSSDPLLESYSCRVTKDKLTTGYYFIFHSNPIPRASNTYYITRNFSK